MSKPEHDATTIRLPKNQDEALVYRFAMDLAGAIMQNPKAAKNGYRHGMIAQSAYPKSRPFSALSKTMSESSVADSQQEEIAFCVGAIAGILNKDDTK